MKRFLTALLAAVLLISACAIIEAPAKAEEFATVTSTNGYGVRMRSGPDYGYNVITKYPVGTNVTVLQRGSSWSQIQVGSTTGWMNNNYLIFGSGSGGSSSSANISGEAATVYAGNGLRTWLRATAGGKRLNLYADGTPVTVIEKGATWSKVYINGSIGYMMTKYIKFGGDPTPSGSGTLKSVTGNYAYPKVGDTLIATLNPSDATATFKWTVDGVEYSTSSELTVLDKFAGKKIKVTATGTGGYTGTVSWTTAEATQDDNWLKGVTLSNTTPSVGDTVSAILQPSSANVTYSWVVDGKEVSTEPTYTIVEDDAGKLLQLKVTAIGDTVGNASATSDEMINGSKELRAVKLSSTQPKAGDTLTATPVPSGASVTYVWKADGIQCATGNSYKVKDVDLGAIITVTATAQAPYTGTATAASERVEKAFITSVSLDLTSPIVGDKVTAAVSPASATATYQWYRDDEPISGAVSKTHTVTSADVGKVLKCEAIGTGVYGGDVFSAATSKVVEYPKVASVKINYPAPIVGNKLSATVTFSPAVSEDMRITLQSSLTYIWETDSEKVAGTAETYTVKDSDATKHVRVTVKGTGNVTGSATSAWTDRVKETMNLSSVKILIGSTSGTNASNTAPAVGETLYAVVAPSVAVEESAVDYTWYRGNTVIGNTSSYTCVAADKGNTIKVVAKPKSGTNYTGEVSATTRAVVQKNVLDVNFNLTLPVAGITPTTSTTGYDNSNKKLTTGTIRWVTDTNGVEAELDEFGTFKPATTYYAEITPTIPANYTMAGATVKVNGSTTDVTVKGNKVYYKCASTSSSLTITDLYITQLGTPKIGETAVTEFSTSQYDATVNWTKGVDADGKFELIEGYEAEITIAPKSGYDETSLPENAFNVLNCASVKYTAGGTKITVTYNLQCDLKIVADTNTVELDGTQDQVVVCYATLNDTRVEAENWELNGDIVIGKTFINESGLIAIAGNEPVGKSLTVSCTYKLGSKTLTAKETIALISGASGKEVKVVFEAAPTSAVANGTPVTFKAHATNSKEGVVFSVESDSNTEKLSNTRVEKVDNNTCNLIVEPGEQAKSVTIVAKAKENGVEAMAKWTVTIIQEEVPEYILIKVNLESLPFSSLKHGTPAEKIVEMMPKAILTIEEKKTGAVSTMTAAVEWSTDIKTTGGVDYDPDKEESQELVAKGTVTLPGNVKNDNEISLEVKSDPFTVEGNGGMKSLSFIKSVLAPVELNNGASEDEVIDALPDTTTITLMRLDGKGELMDASAQIEWNEDTVSTNYDETNKDESVFEVIGKVDIEGLVNPEGLSDEVKLTVTVTAEGQEAKITAIDTTEVNTTVDYSDAIDESVLMAALPTEREVTYDKDGETGLKAMFPVTWYCTGYYDGNDLSAQSVSFKGYVNVNGIDNPDNISADIVAVVHINAKPAEITISNADIALDAIDVHELRMGGYTKSKTVILRNVGGESAYVNINVSNGLFTANPAELTISGQQSAEITFTANLNDVGVGSYDANVTFVCNSESAQTGSISVAVNAMKDADLKLFKGGLNINDQHVEVVKEVATDINFSFDGYDDLSYGVVATIGETQVYAETVKTTDGKYFGYFPVTLTEGEYTLKLTITASEVGTKEVETKLIAVDALDIEDAEPTEDEADQDESSESEVPEITESTEPDAETNTETVSPEEKPAEEVSENTDPAENEPTETVNE